MKDTIKSLIFLLLLGLLLPVAARVTEPGSKEFQQANHRASDATKIFTSVMELPLQRNIPLYVIDNAQVVAIFPASARGGGLMSIRDSSTGEWGAPIFIRFDGGKMEDRLEDGESDLILFGLNRNAVAVLTQPDVRARRNLVALAGPFGQVAEHGDHVPAVSSGFIAYLHSEGNIFGMFVPGATIKYEAALNTAIGQGAPLRPFLTVAENRSALMSLPQALNRYSRNRGF